MSERRTVDLGLWDHAVVVFISIAIMSGAVTIAYSVNAAATSLVEAQWARDRGCQP